MIHKSTIRTGAAMFLGLLTSACAQQEITETGFHQPIPGDFDYFLAGVPACGTTSTAGEGCVFEHDEYGREVSVDCPNTLTVAHSYDIGTKTQTSVFHYDDIRLATWTWTRSFEVSGGLIHSVSWNSDYEEQTAPFESYTRSGVDSYVRDESYRLTRIDSTGSREGSEHFTYDFSDTGSVVTRSGAWQHNGEDHSTYAVVARYNAAGLLLDTTKTSTWNDNAEHVTNTSYTYDGSGRLAESSSEFGTTTYHYDCD